MFGRSRRHHQYQAPLIATPNPNAATAAASAFARRESAIRNQSPAAAAAAAALRARPTTPTNVSLVETKRTRRRSASVSSAASDSRGGLRRSSSSASMTERTLRSPSPHRSVPSKPTTEVPPVPSVPKNVKSTTTSMGKSPPTRHTAVSVQMQPFHVASDNVRHDEGTWFGPPAEHSSHVRTADLAIASPSSERPSSPSINFSYPRGLRVASPSSQPRFSQELPTRSQISESSSIGDQTLVFDPNSRRMVARGELLARSGSVRNSQHQSTKPRKKKQPATDSSLTPQDISVAAASIASARSHAHDEDSDTRTSSPNYQVYSNNLEALPGSLGSLTDRELQKTAGVLPHSLAVSAARSTEISSSPARAGARLSASPIEQIAKEYQRGESPQESITTRTAHFAEPSDQLEIPARHSPPPRSVSPRKSALKFSATPPVGTALSTSSNDSSELLSDILPPLEENTSPNALQTSLPRKKSVRVSFDDQNTIIVDDGAPAELDDLELYQPAHPRRSWYSNLGLGRHKDSVEDEFMKPRPVLPSFGSIREKKHRETEERALVRPFDSPYAPNPTSEHILSPTPSAPSSQPGSLGPSHDHAIGGILANDLASRRSASSSGVTEPLPPVVTSVDGPEYIGASSDEDEDVSAVKKPEPSTPANQLTPESSSSVVKNHQNGTSRPAESDVASPGPGKPASEIPSISVIVPSPPPTDERTVAWGSQKQFLFLPGQFPNDSDDSPTSLVGAADLTTATAPAPVVKAPASPSSPVSTSPLAPIPDVDEGSESSSSIYSDAYEDLSDMEGDGFMSLDAIVSSPIEPKLPKSLTSPAVLASPLPSNEMKSSPTATVSDTAQPSADLPKPTPSRSIVSGSTKESNQEQDEWEHVKEYWKNLTMERRRQLEREAQKEAGELADQESETLPRKRPKKKKSADAKRLVGDSVHVPAEIAAPNTKAIRHAPQPSTTPPSTSTRNVAQSQSFVRTSSGAKLRKRAPNKRETETALDGFLSDTQVTASPKLRHSLRPSSSHSELDHSTPMGRLTSKNLRRPQSMQGSPPDRAPQPAIQPAGKTRRKTLSLDAGRTQLTIVPEAARWQRRGSDSSDTSFKRLRPRPVGSEGMALRRTLRSEDPSPARRFSLRSLSPVGSPFRRRSSMSMESTSHFRTSLRSDSGDSKDGRSKLRLPSLNLRRKKKATSLDASAPTRSAFSSRFDDSSDDEPASRAAFQTRFEDSSDDEGPVRERSKKRPLGPTTVAQSKQNSHAEEIAEASPDLPDSDDDVPAGQESGSHAKETVAGASTDRLHNKETVSSIRRKRSGRGSLIGSTKMPSLGTQSVSSRHGTSPRPSIMSVLRRRRSDNSGRIQRAEIAESAARRDTKLERTPSQLSALRLQGLNGKPWPLAEDDDDDAAGDPGAGADGVGSTAARPGTSRKTTVSSALDGQTHSEPKKKKKFRALRRIFGIDN